MWTPAAGVIRIDSIERWRKFAYHSQRTVYASWPWPDNVVRLFFYVNDPCAQIDHVVGEAIVSSETSGLSYRVWKITHKTGKLKYRDMRRVAPAETVFAFHLIHPRQYFYPVPIQEFNAPNMGAEYDIVFIDKIPNNSFM
jgi:hypothetical protein